jgi:DNA-binding CsgD family transcriptional regulator
MLTAIEASIKTRVIQQWLAGHSTYKIAIDNNIGQSTVSGYC